MALRMIHLWKCSVSFNLIDNKELIWGNFHSNYNCKCLTTSEYDAGSEYEVGDSKYIFQYDLNGPSTDKAFSNLIDENNSLLRNLFIKPNFNFTKIMNFTN